MGHFRETGKPIYTVLYHPSVDHAVLSHLTADIVLLSQNVTVIFKMTVTCPTRTYVNINLAAIGADN